MSTLLSVALLATTTLCALASLLARHEVLICSQCSFQAAVSRLDTIPAVQLNKVATARLLCMFSAYIRSKL